MAFIARFRLHRPVIAASLTLGLLVSGRALAADPESQPYDPSYEGNVVNYAYDSQWVPAMSPVQIRLQAAFLDEVRADMAGDATYDWDDETLSFAGTPNQGSFAYEIGVELTTSVQLNLGGAAIPADVIGPIDLKLPTGGSFDPYLLPGNPDHPLDGSTSLLIPALDQDLNFGPGATGNISLDIQVDFIGLSFQIDQLDCSESDSAAPMASVVMEDEIVDYSLAPPTAPATADIWVSALGELNAMTSIHLLPTVSVTPTGGAPITIGPFDLDVNFPVVSEEPIIFDPLAVPFDGPTPEPPGETGESGDEGEGEATEGEGEETEGSGEAEATGESETETGGDPGVGGGDGCDCRSGDQGRGGTGAALALLGLMGIARRRRR